MTKPSRRFVFNPAAYHAQIETLPCRGECGALVSRKLRKGLHKGLRQLCPACKRRRDNDRKTRWRKENPESSMKHKLWYEGYRSRKGFASLEEHRAKVLAKQRQAAQPVIELRNAGWPFSKIAAHLGITRNAAIGLYSRTTKRTAEAA